MCDVVAIRTTSDLLGKDVHSVTCYLSTPVPGTIPCGYGAAVWFDNTALGEEMTPNVCIDSIPALTPKEARRYVAVVQRAADIAEAGWSDVMRLPTLEQWQAQQAELAVDAREVADARAEIPFVACDGSEDAEAILDGLRARA